MSWSELKPDYLGTANQTKATKNPQVSVESVGRFTLSEGIRSCLVEHNSHLASKVHPFRHCDETDMAQRQSRPGKSQDSFRPSSDSWHSTYSGRGCGDYI